RRDSLLIAAANPHLAPRELHLVPLAQGGDDLVGLDAPGPLDGLDDDVGAGVAPRGAQGRRFLGPRLVLLDPLRELRMSLLHAVVVPREAGRDGADRRFLAERVELVGVADRRAEEAHLVEEAEGAGL